MKISEENFNNIINELDELTDDDVLTTGNIFGYVYSLGKDFDKLYSRLYTKFLHSSGLDVKAYPSAAKMESAVINTMLKLCNCSNGSGVFTNGGTESIILAMKAIRDLPKYHNSVKPNIVLIPETAHPAFVKACLLLKIKYRIIPVDNSYRINYKYLDLTTILREYNIMALIASAPSYGVGVMDNISEASILARSLNCDLVVDGCVGGMILPFINSTDSKFKWDFKNFGVTAITIDLHKYGYCPKGSSVVLYRDKEYVDSQMFTLSSWYGYSIVNSTLANTKSIVSLAGSYATLKLLKYDGYKNIVEQVLSASNRLQGEINDIDGICVLGEPDLNIFSIVSDIKSENPINVYELAAYMRTKGWYIQAQLGYKQVQSSIHISVGYQNLDKIDKFIEDIKLYDRNTSYNTNISSINNMDIHSRDIKLREDYRSSFSVKEDLLRS